MLVNTRAPSKPHVMEVFHQPVSITWHQLCSPFPLSQLGTPGFLFCKGDAGGKPREDNEFRNAGYTCPFPVSWTQSTWWQADDFFCLGSQVVAHHKGGTFGFSISLSIAQWCLENVLLLRQQPGISDRHPWRKDFLLLRIRFFASKWVLQAPCQGLESKRLPACSLAAQRGDSCPELQALLQRPFLSLIHKKGNLLDWTPRRRQDKEGTFSSQAMRRHRLETEVLRLGSFWA